MRFAEAVDTAAGEVQAADAVPRYFAAYERTFELPVHRPVTVTVVCDRGERFVIETDRLEVSARGIINATGTWETPYIPEYPGASRFRGRQLHTKDYRSAAEFVGKHVIVVGAGISAIQLLDEHLNHCVREAVSEGGELADQRLSEASAAIARLVRS
jgi:cation diffusion facilitator CzcD-associated flavoprotein CzcO